MSKKMNVVVGQQVWIKPSGNVARRFTTPIPGVVVNVGNKYFNVKFNGARGGVAKFHVLNGREVTEYTADWVVYLTKQEIDDEQETALLRKQIAVEEFGIGSKPLPLETLREIMALIKAARGKQ